MLTNHPNYQGLKIVSGEDPRQGAFYAVRKGDTLTSICTRAYKAGVLERVLKVNRAAWNRGNCIYRQDSTNCSSAQVNSGDSLRQNSYKPGAWVSLCPGDTQSWAKGLGFAYPVIWIPPYPGLEEPEQLGMKITQVTLPGGQVLPGGLATPQIPVEESSKIDASVPPYIPGNTKIPESVPTTPEEGAITPPCSGDVVLGETPKSRWPWIIGGGIIVGTAVILWAATRGGK